MWAEVMDRHRERQTESEGWRAFHEWFQWAQIRLPSAAWPPLTWMILVVMETGKTSVTLLCFFPLVSEWWKWMWPRDQHAAILAKNQYFFSLSCIGPVSCNISIHMCAQSTLILPVCVSCVCMCVHVREEKNVALNKSCPSCLNCSIKTIFVFDTEKKKKSKLTVHRLDVSLRWRGFCCFVLLFFKFCFSLLCRASSSEGEKPSQSNCARAQGPPGATGGPYFDGGLSIIRTDSMMGSETHCYHCTASANS